MVELRTRLFVSVSNKIQQYKRIVPNKNRLTLTFCNQYVQEGMSFNIKCRTVEKKMRD